MARKIPTKEEFNRILKEIKEEYKNEQKKQ